MSITLQTSQYVVLTIIQVDASNNPVNPPTPGYGAPVLTVSDPTLATVDIMGRLSPLGNVGTATVTATSSKTGAPDLVGTMQVTFVGPVAAALQISASAPINK